MLASDLFEPNAPQDLNLVPGALMSIAAAGGALVFHHRTKETDGLRAQQWEGWTTGRIPPRSGWQGRPRQARVERLRAARDLPR